jgi:hypothetical protein
MTQTLIIVSHEYLNDDINCSPSSTLIQINFVAHCPAFTLEIHHLFNKSSSMALVLLKQTAKIPALFFVVTFGVKT